MVISVNSEPSIIEFQSLLSKAVDTLRSNANKYPEKYCALLGNKLEKEVFDVLDFHAKGTPFEGSIELISGQRFPDIVANKHYGVEVKTTKSNQWKSVGSSVAEGTRVEDVERIFMLFGRMCDPIDFICRPYEECLSEVVVTHSPRYLIDMNLKEGETIFDKINVPYDVLRKQDDPITTVLNYYRKQLKPGETTWWSGSMEESGSNFIIRIWNQMTNREEKNFYKLKGFCLFPEIIGRLNIKYNRLALWLSTKEGIVCPNVRDIYSAGGQGFLKHNGETYTDIPKVIIQLADNIEDIKKVLYSISNEELVEYWERPIDQDPYKIWCSLIAKAAEGQADHFPLYDYLMSK